MHIWSTRKVLEKEEGQKNTTKTNNKSIAQLQNVVGLMKRFNHWEEKNTIYAACNRSVEREEKLLRVKGNKEKSRILEIQGENRWAISPAQHIILNLFELFRRTGSHKYTHLFFPILLLWCVKIRFLVSLSYGHPEKKEKTKPKEEI